MTTQGESTAQRAQRAEGREQGRGLRGGACAGAVLVVEDPERLLVEAVAEAATLVPVHRPAAALRVELVDAAPAVVQVPFPAQQLVTAALD